MSDREAIDARVRQHIFEVALDTGMPPTMAELARRSGLAEAGVRQALASLAAGRMVVLQPESGELLMANPFSAVPTPFLVETPRWRAFGSCIWDAMGIPAMLREPATIRTACGCCGEAMTLDTAAADAWTASDGVVHFAVPAREWWNDIVFT